MKITRNGGLTGSTVTIDGLTATFTDVLLRLERIDGTDITRRLTPDEPSYVFEAEPNRWQVARTYLALGVEHILSGVDHLLFVLALLMVVVGWRRLVGTVTAFTIAHSITLALASLGFVRVPGPPVEAIIALSIVFVAAEIIRGRQGNPGLTARLPWIVAFSFGLLHGFGFAGALSEIGLPQSSIPLALFTFNVGVEIGQLIFIAAVMVVYAIGKRLQPTPPEWAWRVPTYAIGGIAAFWVIRARRTILGVALFPRDQPNSDCRNGLGSSPFSSTSTSAEPTIAPAACLPTAATSSAARIPNPAHTGILENDVTLPR